MTLKVMAPIFGFETIKEVTFEEVDEFFVKIECDEISFTMIDPSKIRNYSFDIPMYYKELLKLNDAADDAKVYNIMVLRSDLTKSTINFAAPIIINTKEKLLVQVALDEQKYADFGLAESIGTYL